MAVTSLHIDRRVLLFGGAACLGSVVMGCGSQSRRALPVTSASPVPHTSGSVAGSIELTALEERFRTRIGVYALDTGTGKTLAHRADERFLLCSTVKALTAAAILKLSTQQPGLLDKIIHYPPSELLLPHAPVTSQHLQDGLSVSALCEAAMDHGDNTAANLLLGVLGGPSAVTAFARSLGDPVTRLDRTEPTLNDGSAGDERDTTTARRIGADLRALVLGDALGASQRKTFTRWLTGSATGGALIPSGFPTGWRIGHKSGSGDNGEVNDIAVIWPPKRAPFIVAVYTDPTNPRSTTGTAVVSAVATLVASRI
jgi:beta-lactamase class A